MVQHGSNKERCVNWLRISFLGFVLPLKAGGETASKVLLEYKQSPLLRLCVYPLLTGAPLNPSGHREGMFCGPHPKAWSPQAGLFTLWFRTAPVSQLRRCLLSLAAEERLPSLQGRSIQSAGLPSIDSVNRLCGDSDTLKSKSKQADVSL